MPGQDARQPVRRWTGKSTGKGMHQSKWGRHCCRPHSHRCVVLSPKRQELGIRCFPVRPSEDGHPVPSPALAPASGSTLQSPRSSAPGPKTLASVPGRPSTGGSAARPSVVVGASSGCFSFRSEDPPVLHPSASGRVGHARSGMTSRFRHRPALSPAEAFVTRVS